MAQKTLRIVNSNVTKKMLNRHCFDGLGDGLLARNLCHFPYATHGSLIHPIAVQRTDKLPVDLKVIYGQSFKITKRRNPATEIIERKTYSVASHRLEKLGSVGKVSYRSGLRHLQAKLTRVAACGLEKVQDFFVKLPITD